MHNRGGNDSKNGASFISAFLFLLLFKNLKELDMPIIRESFQLDSLLINTFFSFLSFLLFENEISQKLV